MGCGCGKQIVSIVKGYKALTEDKLKELFDIEPTTEPWVEERLQQ